ncbi:MAG: phosphatidate cytidylyltransferase [Syntrophomonadaceae bacterium]
MFKNRVVTALIGIPLLLLVLYKGGIYWEIFITLIGILAYCEFTGIMVSNHLKPIFFPGLFLMMVLLYKMNPYFFLVIFCILVFTILFTIIRYPYYNIIDFSVTIFGASYIGFLLGYTIDINSLPLSFLITLLALVLTWSSDTGAYLAGKIWGKHKINPGLSPNKTWEGAVGGLILSTLAAFVFFQITDMAKVSLAYVLALGFLASIFAQFGDLFISWIKRYFRVKDTGKILPGHGGILDRFDSFLLVVPLIYYFAIYILK